MQKIQRYLYISQPFMVIFIPAWVAFGRAFFGAGGWLGFITVPIVGPLLFLGLIIALILIRGRTDIKNKRILPVFESILLLITYIGSLFFGFFLYDGGDNEESYGSAFTKLFNLGGSDNLIISRLVWISLCAAFISLLLLVIYSFLKRFEKK